jgi:hypothetical protein
MLDYNEFETVIIVETEDGISEYNFSKDLLQELRNEYGLDNVKIVHRYAWS